MININRETEEQLEKGPKFLDRAKIECTLFEVARCFPKINYIDEITLEMLEAKEAADTLAFDYSDRMSHLPEGWTPSGVVETPNFYFWAE